jgi:glycosyltransferase involved in cell wall biosynthesis
MNFCFIPWINWDSYLHSRPHQLVREALRRGHRVLYLNPGIGPAQKDGNLEVWHPLSHPFFGTIRKILRGDLLGGATPESNEKLTPMRRWVYRPYEEGNRQVFFSKYLVDLLTRQKLRAFRDREGGNVIIFEQPFPLVYQIPYLKGLGYTVIYDLIDDWSAYQDAPGYFLQTEPYLLQNADIVTATAKPLYQRALQYNKNTHLCPNAADLEHFAEARRRWEKPKDLPERKPIVGFFGIIREWFDVGLIRYAGLHRPQFRFCLIGGYSQNVFEQLRDLENVHFLGEKNYSVLPQYLSYFNVTMIPFITNGLIRSTNPIKVYEYLAGGKPVVATYIPEIENMPFVYLSKGSVEFVKNLDQAIEASPDLREIDAFLEEQTWTKRFDTIERAIKKLNSD